MRQAGVFVRATNEREAKCQSEWARRYAKIKDWHVAELYDLSGVSGKSVLEHPEAKRMLADIASGKITALIFSKLDRLGRNVRELWDIADYFQKHEAFLASLEESIDTSTPAGRVLLHVFSALWPEQPENEKEGG
jgi:site-specific DNA recombinase